MIEQGGVTSLPTAAMYIVLDGEITLKQTTHATRSEPDQHAGCLAGLSVAVQGFLTRFRRLLDDRLYSKSQEELEDQLSKVGQSWDVLIEQSEIEIARLVQNEWKRRMGHRALVAWSLHREPISSE